MRRLRSRKMLSRPGHELDPQVAVTVADHGEAPPSSRTREAPIIAERYRLDHTIAEGGMGLIFKGWHLVLNQPVAIKIIRREYLHSAEAVQSFVDEARALAALRGPSVARVLDAGLQDGMPFIVMELLEGRDLRSFAHRRGPVPYTEAAKLVREAAEGAAEAHEQGIVHCDLKPENLFVAKLADGTERVKVIDFGISARQRDGEAVSEGLFKRGSPEYMAPEQLAENGVVDPRSDVWALGVVLYELVTGKKPFTADSVDEICKLVVSDEPQSMSSLGADVPVDFAELVMKCLDKSPDGRFETAAELVEALLPFQQVPEDVDEGEAAATIPPPSRFETHAPWKLSAAAVGGVLLLLVIGWFVFGAGPRKATPSATPPARNASVEQNRSAAPTNSPRPAQQPDEPRSGATIVSHEGEAADHAQPRRTIQRAVKRTRTIAGPPEVAREDARPVKAFPDAPSGPASAETQPPARPLDLPRLPSHLPHGPTRTSD